MSLDHRFARYAALAAVPAAVTGAAHAQLDPNTNYGTIDTTDIVINRGSFVQIGSFLGTMALKASFTTQGTHAYFKVIGGAGTVNWWQERSYDRTLAWPGLGADGWNRTYFAPPRAG